MAISSSRRSPKDSPLDKIDWKTFGSVVIGVDEVGRGCLAGPVYAAAVLFAHDECADEVQDSKKLTPKKREELSGKIRAAHPFAIGEASIEEIDELNILWASLLAMQRAVETLQASIVGAAGKSRPPVLVDGHMKIPHLRGHQQVPLVKGDLRCAPVSAASIVAKVARDAFMVEQAALYPQYGFHEHKGYLTALHREALQKHGPTRLHRRSFSGVKELL